MKSPNVVFSILTEILPHCYTMAGGGVREFLTALDHSLVDIDAVITDLAKEDCDDIEVIRIR